MNREIKFRAWRKTVKEIMVWSDLKEWVNPLGEDDDHILMQYTGLKDKNGKEIYEGDLLGEENNDWGIRKVIFEDGGFYAPLIKHHFAVGLNQILVNHSCLQVEIIGNIYSTPELLEETPSIPSVWETTPQQDLEVDTAIDNSRE